MAFLVLQQRKQLSLSWWPNPLKTVCLSRIVWKSRHSFYMLSLAFTFVKTTNAHSDLAFPPSSNVFCSPFWPPKSWTIWIHYLTTNTGWHMFSLLFEERGNERTIATQPLLSPFSSFFVPPSSWSVIPPDIDVDKIKKGGSSNQRKEIWEEQEERRLLSKVCVLSSR